MESDLLSKGFYFKEVDWVKEGYYTEDDQGNLIHHDYKPPTKWEKFRHRIIYGYPLNSSPVSISYYYFFPHMKTAYHGLMSGNVLKVAKSLKPNRYSGSCYKYQEEGESLFFETEENTIFINFFDNYRKLYARLIKKKNQKDHDLGIYTFFDWDIVDLKLRQ